MKKFIICSFLASTVLLTSCIGSFSAFNRLKDWNQNVTSSKFGNELIFIVLWVLPVYGLATLGDVLIFNSIEFWGGDNPIAMEDGDSETRTIVSKGNKYEITATKNRFHVVIVDGERQGESADLVYTPDNETWNLEKEGELIKLASLKKGLLMAHLPNGEAVEVPSNLNRLATADFLDTKINEYTECNYAELIVE